MILNHETSAAITRIWLQACINHETSYVSKGRSEPINGMSYPMGEYTLSMSDAIAQLCEPENSAVVDLLELTSICSNDMHQWGEVHGGLKVIVPEDADWHKATIVEVERGLEAYHRREGFAIEEEIEPDAPDAPVIER